MNTENNESRDSNPDPITGAPGSHPVATGVGAASAGLAGAAIGTAVGGPVGGVVGAVIGAVSGGYGGKATGEVIDPTAEDAYWQENHGNQTFGNEGSYDDYAPAYRTGYQGYKSGSTFDESESDVRSNYETLNPTVPWEKAKSASRAAWERVEAKARAARDA